MRLDIVLLIHSVFATTIQLNNVFDYDCQTDTNCTNVLPNSICINNKCICKFGYELNGCRLETYTLRHRRQISLGMKMIGEECDRPNQCRQTPVDGTKVCLANKCQCAHGYVPIDAYRCVQDFQLLSSDVPVTNSYDNEPAGYGSVCSINSECQQNTNHLRCLRGTCVCLEGYVPLGKYLCYHIRAPSTSTIQSSIMISTTLSRTTTATIPTIKNDAMKPLGKIGNTCTNDYFCRQTIPQSHCYNGKCTCAEGYISTDQYTCVKDFNEETTIRSTLTPVDYKSLLGGHCLTKRNCHTSNAVCLNSACTCPKGYFPVDDWTCLQEPESSDEELYQSTTLTTKRTTTRTTRMIIPTTTTFRWWPWSPTPTTPSIYTNLKNAFRVRCLLNRQCASMDKNSHCTLFGRCICNPGYLLKTTSKGQHCISRLINEDDCD